MPSATFSYWMGFQLGLWIWRKLILAPLLVAEYISTGMETSESLIWPFQMGRIAMSIASRKWGGVARSLTRPFEAGSA